MNRKHFLALAIAALLLSGPAFAQLQTGSIHGTTIGQDGGALPGVTLTLSGVGAQQVQVSDGQGKFRFLGLSPGTYTLKTELDGFVPLERTNLDVSVGRNTEIELTLAPSDFGEIVTVVADEAPLLDPRRIAPESIVSRVEMDSVPTARDPWAILGTVAGVRSDRINV